VIDEAPGVRPEIYEAIEGIRAGGDVRVLARQSHHRQRSFYDAFSETVTVVAIYHRGLRYPKSDWISNLCWH
jgi:hypothetical protein